MISSTPYSSAVNDIIYFFLSFLLRSFCRNEKILLKPVNFRSHNKLRIANELYLEEDTSRKTLWTKKENLILDRLG